jgi:hypothetical protein
VDSENENSKQTQINGRQLEDEIEEFRPLQEGLLTFKVHNWRPVNPYDLSDPAQDYFLFPGEHISV